MWTSLSLFLSLSGSVPRCICMDSLDCFKQSRALCMVTYIYPVRAASEAKTILHVALSSHVTCPNGYRNLDTPLLHRAAANTQKVFSSFILLSLSLFFLLVLRRVRPPSQDSYRDGSQFVECLQVEVSLANTSTKTASISAGVVEAVRGFWAACFPSSSWPSYSSLVQREEGR